MRKSALLFAVLATLSACGSRTGLLGVASDAGPASDAGGDEPDAQATCPVFPPIPPTPPAEPGAACTFAPNEAATPVLAAIAGQDLVALTSQATVIKLFHFDTGANASGTVVSRGDYLGALETSSPAPTKLEVEFVLLRLDGSVLVHHHETFTVKDFGGMAGVVGNAAGTFGFGAAMGDFGGVWVALAQGSLLGPFGGVAIPYGGIYSPRAQPDERGRFTVLPVTTNSTADVYWLDPCTGTRKPVVLSKDAYAVGVGRKLFGVTYAGQLSTETADGVTPLPHPSLGTQFGFWDFDAPYAMFEVPPFPPGMGTAANLEILNAETLTDELASLEYPGLSVLPPDAWLSSVGDSNNPAGFGLDSGGHVTMFLADAAGVIHLHVTTDGKNWTPIGTPVGYDTMFGPSYSLKFAEAGGTYLVQGSTAGVGMTWQVARPSSNVNVPLGGRGNVSSDGGCVAALVSSTELDVVNATSGAVTKIALPFTVDQSAWVSTFIPGDDAVMPAY